MKTPKMIVICSNNSNKLSDFMSRQPEKELISHGERCGVYLEFLCCSNKTFHQDLGFDSVRYCSLKRDQILGSQNFLL